MTSATTSPAHLWSRRSSDPELVRHELSALREQITLTELATRCNADKSQLRLFLQPAPPAEEIDRLKHLLNSIPRNRLVIAQTIADLRAAGWSMAQIGRATGRSRQRIAVLAEHPNPGSRIQPRQIPSPRTKPEPSPRPAPCYRQARSLTDSQLEPLLTAHQHYLSRRRRRADHPDRIAAEDLLADAALILSATTRVPVAALSARLGMARATLPAICDRSAQRRQRVRRSATDQRSQSERQKKTA